ncbi:MAG: hypothetical protein ACRERE_33460 [Candidatus Entotheonellia bacterium]
MAPEWANRLSSFEAACQLAPKIRTAVDQIEAARELPKEVARQIWDENPRAVMASGLPQRLKRSRSRGAIG